MTANDGLVPTRNRLFAIRGVLFSFSVYSGSNLWRERVRERAKPGSTKVLLREFRTAIESLAVVQNRQCETLERLKREAVEAVLNAKRTRWTKDVSLYEDNQIASDQRRRIDAFISHLLAGHDGQPCPSGDRPIIGRRVAADLNIRTSDFLASPVSSTKN